MKVPVVVPPSERFAASWVLPMLPAVRLAPLRPVSALPLPLKVPVTVPVNEGEATEYGEIISDESASDPLEMLSDKNLHGEIDGLLSLLNDRERRIIDERFGLNGLKPMLLEDVGREFGVSPRFGNRMQRWQRRATGSGTGRRWVIVRAGRGWVIVVTGVHLLPLRLVVDSPSFGVVGFARSGHHSILS